MERDSLDFEEFPHHHGRADRTLPGDFSRFGVVLSLFP